MNGTPLELCGHGLKRSSYFDGNYGHEFVECGVVSFGVGEGRLLGVGIS